MLYDVAPHVPKEGTVTDHMLMALIRDHGSDVIKKSFPSYLHPAYKRVRTLLLQQIQISHTWDSTTLSVRDIDEIAKKSKGQTDVVP